MKRSVLILCVVLAAPSLVCAAERLHAEQIVEIAAPAQAACVSEAALRQFGAHAVAGEKTKAAAMFPDTCSALVPGKRLKLFGSQGRCCGIRACRQQADRWLLGTDRGVQNASRPLSH